MTVARVSIITPFHLSKLVRRSQTLTFSGLSAPAVLQLTAKATNWLTRRRSRVIPVHDRKTPDTVDVIVRVPEFVQHCPCRCSALSQNQSAFTFCRTHIA